VNTEESRLPAARRADDADEIVARDVEADSVDRQSGRLAGVRIAVFDPYLVGFEMRGL
jgi:hypothetical protein